MSIVDACNELLEKILEINNSVELVRTDPNEDIQDSEDLFVNSAINPTSIQMSVEEGYRLTSESPYPQNALQALWNVASMATEIITQEREIVLGLKYRKKILANLTYLDENTNVLRIIDEKTYNLGLAIKAFLLELLNVKKGLLTKAHPLVSPLLPILEQRLRFFEAHSTQDAILTSVNNMRQRDARIALWETEWIDFDNCTNFENTLFRRSLNATLQGLESSLNANPEQQLLLIESAINSRREIIEQIRVKIASFELFQAQWNVENSDLHLPAAVAVSNYMKTLASNTASDEAKRSQWHNLLNYAPELFDEPIDEALQEKARRGSASIHNAYSSITLIEQQIESLNTRRNAILALQRYEQELAEYLVLPEGPFIPNGLTCLDGNLNYEFQPSNAENHVQRLEENKQSYTSIMEKFAQFEISLSEREQALRVQHHHIHTTGLPQEAVSDYKPSFVATRNKVLLELEQKIERIRTDKRRILELQRQVDALLITTSQELTLSSHEEKTRLLEEAEANVCAKYAVYVESRLKAANAKDEYELMPKGNTAGLSKKKSEKISATTSRHLELVQQLETASKSKAQECIRLKRQAIVDDAFYNLALLKRSVLILDCKLAEIQPNQTILNQLLDDTLTRGPIEVLSTLARQQDSINEVNQWLQSLDSGLCTNMNSQFEHLKILQSEILYFDEENTIQMTTGTRGEKQRLWEEQIQLTSKTDKINHHMHALQTSAETLSSRIETLLLEQLPLSIEASIRMATQLRAEGEQNQKRLLTDLKTLLRNLELLLTIKSRPNEDVDQQRRIANVHYSALLTEAANLEAQIADSSNNISSRSSSSDLINTDSRASSSSSISSTFFGEQNDSLSGIFGDYLVERHATYFWHDFFGNIAAFLLCCLCYKTDAEKRREYISELQGAVNDFEKDPNTLGSLNKCIKDGFNFKARENGSDTSLQSKLKRLQEQVQLVVSDQKNELDPKEEEQRTLTFF